MKKTEAIGVAIDLWYCFRDQKWDEARELLDDNFEATWPQSREIIKGPENFIRINREYQGTHKIKVYNSLHHLDRWEFIDHVVTVTFIETTDPDGKIHSLYATSFFKIQEERILRGYPKIPEALKHITPNTNCISPS